MNHRRDKEYRGARIADQLAQLFAHYKRELANVKKIYEERKKEIEAMCKEKGLPPPPDPKPDPEPRIEDFISQEELGKAKASLEVGE